MTLIFCFYKIFYKQSFCCVCFFFKKKKKKKKNEFVGFKHSLFLILLIIKCLSK